MGSTIACPQCGGPTHFETAGALGALHRCDNVMCAAYAYAPTSDPNVLHARGLVGGGAPTVTRTESLRDVVTRNLHRAVPSLLDSVTRTGNGTASQ